MIASEAVKERIQFPLTAESLSTERIAYLDGLVRQARAAAGINGLRVLDASAMVPRSFRNQSCTLK
jgi:hypothetical protein